MKSPDPSAPVHSLSAPELKARLDRGGLQHLVDVRTPQERAIARIEGARLLDEAYHDELLGLDRGIEIVFHCHHGVRSLQAAEYFRRHGFSNLFNLEGGIEAWSVLVDPAVPRY